ncbi:NUDIX hydrolase [Streptomyces sp. KR55]|uniref:NUDIX hydrolase n=1 Tax=Streptomyces sp. KR55 TaxID=3457425 RepID=UPI003FD5722E
MKTSRLAAFGRRTFGARRDLPPVTVSTPPAPAVGLTPAEKQAAATGSVLAEIRAERNRQDAKFGEQNHPDGTGTTGYIAKARAAREKCQRDALSADGPLWSLVLLEEVYEALAEADPAQLRAELVQVAAVACAWIEAIDRRTR